MTVLIDLTKERFERLVVIERAENNKHGHARWKCQCDCGKITIVSSRNLVTGNTKSCGCLSAETRKKVNTKHGMCRSVEYNTWRGMLERCNNPKNIAYQRYGGRNITVCDRWYKFENFFEDMGFRPKELTIERRDNEEGYSKTNCYWANKTVQSRNRRISKTNKTGVRGVRWNKVSKRYQVNIGCGYKQLFLGCFTELEQAVEARKQAEQKYWR